LKGLENNPQAQEAMGFIFYGAKLMASVFNTINPVYYAKLPKHLQAKAIQDVLLSYTTVTASIAGLAYATGATVSFDIDDPDFLVLTKDGKHLDLTGGRAGYFRTAARIFRAIYYAANPTKTKFETKEKVEKGAWSGVKFFRNKLAPVPSYVTNAFFGKDTMGDDFNPTQILEVWPMYAEDVIDAAKKEGVTTAMMVFMANAVGLGYNAYYADPEEQPIEETMKRMTKSDEQNKALIKNYNDGGREITNEEFQKYIDERDAFVAKKVEEWYAKGRLILDGTRVVRKKFNEMTEEQVLKEAKAIQTEATKEVKEKMFGEKKEKPAEIRAKKKLLELKNKEQ
jgi:hypothetical protein